MPPVKSFEEAPPEAPDFFSGPDPTVTRTAASSGLRADTCARGLAPFTGDGRAAGSVVSPLVGDDERWRALAEQISMQVLQRIDLFTDTGLKAQLASHLSPIVAHAGAELVEAINDHVGKLIRQLCRRGDRARDRAMARR